MKIVIQRVLRASVRVGGEVRASIGPGLLLLVGVERGDDARRAEAAADRITNLRIFPAEGGADDRMDRSVIGAGAEILVVPQFTLAGSLRRGRRPSFDAAAPPQEAEAIYLKLVEAIRQRGVPARTGVFGAMMEVELVNDGPVTFVLEPAS